MKLHQLQALVAVADSGSIRAAARQLGLSQTAVAKALRELEGEKQVALLVRHPSGVAFTEFGQALLVHARLILAQMGRAEAELDSLRGLKQGRLVIGVTPLIALTFLSGAIGNFRARFPDVQLEIYEGLMAVTLPQLRSGKMDFAIGPIISALPPQEFDCKELLMFEDVVIANRNHPKINSRSLHDLQGQDWVINYVQSSHDELMNNLFWQHGIQPESKHIICAHSLSLLIELIRNGGMLSFCPALMLTTEPFRDWVQALALSERFNPYRMGIVRRRDMPNNALAQGFIDCLLQEIRRRARSAKAEDSRLFEYCKLLI